MQPILMEIYTLHIHANVSEGVNIGLALAAPINEFDAEFEGAIGGFQKFCFINTKHSVEIDHVRDGGFAHTHGSNFIRLDESDSDIVWR